MNNNFQYSILGLGRPSNVVFVMGLDHCFIICNPKNARMIFFQKMPACALIGACAVNGSITVVGLKDRQIEQDQQINDLINRL
jgi:hypothetical protein